MVYMQCKWKQQNKKSEHKLWHFQLALQLSLPQSELTIFLFCVGFVQKFPKLAKNNLQNVFDSSVCVHFVNQKEMVLIVLSSDLPFASIH